MIRAAGAISAALILAGLAPKPAAADSSVSVAPVAFQVVNVNLTGVPCAADGATYTIAGRLFAPTGAAPSSVTLYLHGLGFGEFFWDFSQVSGLNYAEAQARAGQASLVIDRLGYGASGHPQGQQSCFGSQATVAHQLVGDLRTGSYQVNGRAAGHAFRTVVLAGHSAGGAIAELEASSFHDVDGLVVLSYADLGATPRATSEASRAGADCAQGGQPAGPGEPGGYAPFGQTAADFDQDMFFSASPAAVRSATALRHLDPCGDDNSFPATISHNLAGLGSVTVPVLLVYGADDALFQPPGTTDQARLFAGSSDVSTVMLPDTGHALTLERTAPQFRRDVSTWLGARGF